ncbi:MAG: YqgE/AlgH family protein [Gammaproteobacteria bacterium]|nr:YqgE/AlgH family protein [Gammaproteobacteria bacterium]MDH5692250.1 YqgE/AlgH family protein [Gammaproteobacteria bacterium]
MDMPANLTNQFLIAMPGLQDPNFYQSVTYICEHNENGALGVVINRETDVSLAEVITQLGLDWDRKENGDQRVFLGGPVDKQRGFIIHDPVGDWGSTIKVTDTIGVTTSRDIIEAIAQSGGPIRRLVALGYAGWGAGQLEQEMAANAWLNGPADPHIIFDLPVEERWEAAALCMGVDLRRLSNDVGHA